MSRFPPVELRWRDETAKGPVVVMPCQFVDGQFTTERPQEYKEFRVPGSYPTIQVTAVGAETFEADLDLWGPEGERFWTEHLKPAYGGLDGTFRPHRILLVWGTKSTQAFRGYLVGQPPVKHEMGRKPGTIFARTLTLKLVRVQNEAVRAVAAKPASKTTGTSRTATNAAATAAANTARTPARTYTVVSGDTLGGIAKKFGVTLKALAEANGRNINNILPVGTKLTIPDKK